MENHELFYQQQSSLFHEDHGWGEDFQLCYQPCSLVMAHLQSIDQVLFSSSPNWHMVDQIEDENPISYLFSCLNSALDLDIKLEHKIT